MAQRMAQMRGSSSSSRARAPSSMPSPAIRSIRPSVAGSPSCSSPRRPAAGLPQHVGSGTSFPTTRRCSRVLVVASATSGDAVTVQQQQQKTPLPPLLSLDDPRYEGRHTFSTFSNWLLPGAVMMGRYPFVEPSRCPSREQGEWQLRQVLEAGITTFCCLQEELPSQEELRLVGKNGFMPYKSTAELIQCSLNGPPPSEIVNGLRNPTLNKFLPTKKQPPPTGTASRYSPKQLHFLHRPIVGDGADGGALCPERLAPLLADLRRRLEAGEVVYLHSWGGRGRAGMLGACLLAQLYGVGADEAVERVQRAFRTRGRGGAAGDGQLLETPEQLESVRQYIDSHCSGAAN